MNKLTYKDFETGKPKWTRGRFLHWTERQGPLNVRYAAVVRDRSMLFIPEYCLTVDSKRAIDYEMKCRETPGRVLADCPKMTKPVIERKHLFGILQSRGKRRGYFLANSPDRNVNRDVAREMFEEARSEGLDRPLVIYCATCTYGGPGLDIIQIDCEGL